MIVCSECGRAVSDKAAACIGCGAPIASPSQIDWVPRAARVKPATLKQLRLHLLGGSVTLGLGLCAALATDSLPGSGVDKLAGALLLIAGIAWTLVTLVRLWAFERP
jgi:hypothetical protein